MAKDKDYQDRIDLATRKIESAGGIVVASFIQRRGVSRSRYPGGAKLINSPLNSRTLFSSGKVKELEELIAEKEIEILVLLGLISQRQIDVLERLLKVSVYLINKTAD